MKKLFSRIPPLGMFFLITTSVFFLWLLLVACFMPAIKRYDSQTDYIPSVESLSTALAAAAVFGAGYIAYIELNEVSNSRYMEVADRLFDELNSPENIEARRRIFQNLPADPKTGAKRLSAKDREAMKLVLNSLDRVSFLTQKGWVPEDLVMPWMHPMIAKSWEKLEPYVKHERERRGEPYYYQYAEEIANRCKLWRQKNSIDTPTKWVKDAL